MTSGPDPRGGAAGIGALWTAIALRGALFAGFGAATIIWPAIGVALLVWAAVAYLILDGLTGVLIGGEPAASRRRMAQAIGGVALGAAALLRPELTERALVVGLALWLVWQGVDLVLSGRALAREAPQDGQLLKIVGGALAAVGAAALIWRGVGEALAGWLVAAAALAIGAALIHVALRLRRLARRTAG